MQAAEAAQAHAEAKPESESNASERVWSCQFYSRRACESGAGPMLRGESDAQGDADSPPSRSAELSLKPSACAARSHTPSSSMARSQLPLVTTEKRGGGARPGGYGLGAGPAGSGGGGEGEGGCARCGCCVAQSMKPWLWVVESACHRINAPSAACTLNGGAAAPPRKATPSMLTSAARVSTRTRSLCGVLMHHGRVGSLASHSLLRERGSQ